MAYIGKTPTIGNFQVCDAISVVNGQAAYTMQVGSVNVSPESANHMLVSLNGILQKPGSSFTVSGSTITFASNLVTGDVIDFIQILGNVLDLGVPSDATVSLAKLTATGTKNATTFLRGDNTFAEAGGTNTPAFAVRKSADQSGVGTSSNVKITFETEIVDTDNAFASSKFTIPSGEAGKYAFYGNIRNNTGTDFDTFQIMLFKNGSAFDDYYAMFDNVSQASNNSSFSAIVDCAVGDYFEVYCYQTSGGNLSIRQNGSHFYGYKLIGV